MAATFPSPWLIELVADILRRLPEKTVARFRCVSKEWSSLSSDPYFANLRRQNHPDWKLIARDGLLYSLDLGSLDCALRVDYLRNSNFTVKKIWGFSNGKLCLSVSGKDANPVAEPLYPLRVTNLPPAELTGDIIVICDLTTGARRIVPPSPVDFRVESLDDVPLRTIPAEWGRCKVGDLGVIAEEYRRMPADMWRNFSYGFGFDPSSEDYKLVRISQYILVGSSRFKHCLLSEVKVYSMKTDSWSRIDRDISRFYIHDKMEPVHVGGVLYWVAGGFFIPRKWESCRDLVVAFDLAEESFRGMAPEEGRLDLLCLGSMGGKLCVLGEASGVKLWRVEDHGDVWTPLVSFAKNDWFPRRFFIYSEAMAFSKNGDKVLVDDICCDLTEGTMEKCRVKFV